MMSFIERIMGTYLKIAIKNVASPICDFQYAFMIMIIAN